MHTLICSQCFKEFFIKKIYRNGRSTCSNECRSLLRMKTTIEKYGIANISQLDSVKAKKTETFLDHYGTSHYFKTDEFNKQKSDTIMEKYGVLHQSSSHVIKQQKKDTMLSRYGVENPSQVKEFQDKKIATSMERYGVDHPSMSQSVKDKCIATNLEKYGVEYSLQSPYIRDKGKATMVERYGVPVPNGTHISSDKYTLLHDIAFLKKENDSKSITEIAELLGVTPRTVYLRFNEHNIIPNKFTESFPEKEISVFLDGIGVTYEKNITHMLAGKQELDFYLPEFNLAIEHNGTYWHSECSGNKSKEYHLSKTLACNTKNIHLVHVRGDEWAMKQDIIKSILLSLLNKNDKIYARRCVIKELDDLTYKNFLSNNHIQGYVPGKHKLGLFYNGKLVSCMSFGINRFKQGIELLRFCNVLNTTVVGAASKLFSYYIKTFEPDSIISYSHKDKFTGGMYKILGFEYSHTSAPAYYYTKDYMNFSNRLKYQKHKLSKILPVFDENLTEWQNMQNNGYDRIWDCGNDVWTYHRNKIDK